MDETISGNETFRLEVEEVNEIRGIMSIACLVCLRRRLYLLPLITTLWIIMSLFVSYGIAVSYGHTEPDFPYISHTAIEAPERCVFGQLVNIGAVMLVMNVLVRYLFLKEIFKHKKMENVHQWQNGNMAGVVIGVLSALGMSMVANFQTEVQRAPHYAGAGLAFVMGTAYTWLQTCITWRLRREGLGSKFLAVARFINCFLLSCFLIIFTISKTYYKIKEYQGEASKNGPLRGVYLTSTISEWLVAGSILAYTLSFTWDFRSIVLESPKVKLNFQQLENGNNNNRLSTEVDPRQRGTTPV